jgi:hypothetical protein
MFAHGKDYLGAKIREPWFDEGMADYVASLWDPAFIDRRASWLRDRIRSGAPAPPSFDDLRTMDGFYGHGNNADLQYWLSALLMRRLLGPAPQGAPVIRKILDALAASEDPQASVQKATGKKPRAEYRALVSEFWPQGH